MLFLALDPGKVWRDIGSSGPAPPLNDSRTARQSLRPEGYGRIDGGSKYPRRPVFGTR